MRHYCCIINDMQLNLNGKMWKLKWVLSKKWKMGFVTWLFPKVTDYLILIYDNETVIIWFRVLFRTYPHGMIISTKNYAILLSCFIQEFTSQINEEYIFETMKHIKELLNTLFYVLNNIFDLKDTKTWYFKFA